MKHFATPSPTRRTTRTPRRRPAAQARGPAITLRRTEIRQILHGPRLQAKLTLGPPDDAYEREADRVADAVLRMPEPDERVQRMCPECEDELQRQPMDDLEEEEELRTKSLPGPRGEPSEISDGLAARIQALRGGGRPLPEPARAFFEPRFGRSFAGVRIHDDSRAQALARSVHARAFTVGRDVVLGAGEPAPGTPGGRRLLAHELTHVVQQTGGGP
ncbi:MAG: DUF4157 domain-containing protein [Acidobacteriota bacterium]|jgi:hypothetical protein